MNLSGSSVKKAMAGRIRFGSHGELVKNLMREVIHMCVRKLSLMICLAALPLVGVQLGLAVEKEGHLVIHATPNVAYVYADGEPVWNR